MLFNSLEFFLFFPFVAIVYFILPKRIAVRNIWLLIASYIFYMNWNPSYALLLLTSTFVTYLCSRLVSTFNDKKNNDVKYAKYAKASLIGCLIINLLILFFFKYFNFFTGTIYSALEAFGISYEPPSFNVLLPVGISFYIFQALGYSIDVYRGDVKAEKNFLTYALFVSFFPQLVAGPIERSSRLLPQFKEEHRFDYDRFKEGLMLMLYGYFLKLVLADRICKFVDVVYEDLDTYTGVYVLIASILFAFQIYCDFAGYSTIAIGVSKILGFNLMENFDSPYLSQSVAEFWRRWHISLSTWFKDYLYIPLGGSRCKPVRNYINLMIVFLVSGLWHGANWTYVIWGGINGLYQVISKTLSPLKKKVQSMYNPSLPGCSFFRAIGTFLLIDFSWIFFRADTITNAFKAIKSIFTQFNPWVLFDGSLYTVGLNQKNFQLMWIAIGILIIADICKYKGIIIREKIEQQILPIRWLIYLIAILGVTIFGVWGPGYNAANFIYFQF